MNLLSDLQADWPAIHRLLDQALDLPPAERGAWLQSLPADAAGLKDTLAKLLDVRAGIETGGFLGTLPKLDGAPGLVPDRPDIGAPQAGDEVGPWRLIRELGEGGMGSVWLAERADGQLKRQVALKLPRLTWARGLAERMARERDILATLEHPHIARLYDAGVDKLGRPWLALEYVQGRPIDEYAKDKALTVRQRVELLLQVCEAAAYAHSRLVIHRDLKPSNILVTDEGQVRLLDFGIAKLVQGDKTEATALTKMAGGAMTLDYASPEQIQGEPLSTAGDVYSLGVVAYELLAGARPYRLKRGSAAELEEAILNAEVPPASGAAVDPAFRTALKGDLDAILNLALKKSPAERYATVTELAQDLRAGLSGSAISARPDTAAVRLLRWSRRHRFSLLGGSAMAGVLALAVGVGPATLAIAALATGLALALWQAAAARRGRAAAEASRRIAQREAERAAAAAASERAASERARHATLVAEREAQSARREEQRAAMVSNFMLDAFARVAADPQVTDPRVRAAMQQALEQELELLQAKSTDRPGALAEVFGAAAALFNYLGASALQSMAAERELHFLQQAGESAARIADAHRQLALALSRQGDAAASVRHSQLGLAVAPTDPGLESRTLRARLQRGLARYASALGDYAQALDAARAAVREFEGLDDASLALSLGFWGSAQAELAVLCAQAGLDVEAQRRLDEVEAKYRVQPPRRESDRADLEMARGRVWFVLDHADEAVPAFRRAAVLYAPQFGASGLNADIVDGFLARALIAAGEVGEAAAIVDRIVARPHGEVVWLQAAALRLAQGRLDEAAEMLQRQETDPTQRRPERQLEALLLWARLWQCRGVPEAARRAASEAVALGRNALPGAVAWQRRAERLLEELRPGADAALTPPPATSPPPAPAAPAGR